MTFLYLNNFASEINPFSEINAIKNTLFFGKQTFAISFHVLPLSLLLIPKMTDKKVIEVFPKYFSQTPGITKESVDQFYSELLFFRNKKNKNRQELVVLGMLEKKMGNIHDDVRNYYHQLCEFYKMNCLKEFVENKELMIYSFLNRNAVVEDQLFPNVLEDLSSTNKMCYFDETIIPFTTEISANDSNIAFLDYDDSIILNLPFFNIPSSDSLTYNQLKHAKQEMNELLINFYTAIEAFEKEVYFLDFDSKNIITIQEKLNEFILPHLAEIKAKVEGIVYFSQIINSVEKPPMSTIKLGISSLKTMVSLLKARKVISESDGEILMKIGRAHV